MAKKPKSHVKTAGYIDVLMHDGVVVATMVIGVHYVNDTRLAKDGRRMWQHHVGDMCLSEAAAIERVIKRERYDGNKG